MNFEQNTPQRDARLLAAASELALPGLGEAFAAALTRFDDALFDRAERAGSSQPQFLDAMRELRLRRDYILAAFNGHLRQAWRALEAGLPLSAERVLAGESGEGGLSLVPEHVLESRLAVRNFATVLLRDCKQQLARIDRRIGWVAGGLELDADSNPVGPEHVAVAIHQAFASSDLSAEARLVVIKLCERELSPAISKIYESLDACLASAGVLPQVAPLRRTPAAPPPPPASLEDNPAADDDSQYAPAWAQRFVDRWAHSTGRMEAGAAAGGGRGMGGEADGLSNPAVLLDALNELLAQRRGAESPVPLQGERALNSREMMNVLSLLQSTPSATLSAAIGEHGESLAQRLKSEVLHSAGQLGMAPGSTRLDAADEDAIDLVGMLFDVMLDERDLAGRSRELIGRLIVPFVKVALLDRRMFVQKTHPARKLLNSLAEACEGNTGQTPAERVLMGKVEEITERLVAEFNENLAIFLTLEEEFRDFLIQHRRKVEIAERRAAETQRGQERLEQARRRAAAEVARRVDGQEDMPKAIVDFLSSPWQHHLALCLLREGDEAQQAAAESLQLADAIIDELGEARRHIVGKPWLQAQHLGLRKIFASIGLHDDAAATAIDALHDTLQAVAERRPEDARELPELPQVVLPSAPATEAPSEELQQAAASENFDHADADRFRQLAVGTWLDFIDKDGKVQAGKLSWVSPISGRLLFVNRRGVRFCVASPEELAVMVQLGRLRAHASDGAFDSAMQGVIDRLDANAGNDLAAKAPPAAPTVH
ncbi:thymidine phosphorylase [Stenotrophomonas ginsengisoli]|uniref:Thymidine phosphorylase n=1 Tax=Stenotrophomonas ginsengisoli TaxID=336566 RepID=A0A0R0D6N3_9GAMM|nr:DUF1631 domain-containing protein [Stenotrophomonas ginsengisoli]KRG77200.1 thymidine phosphorylase [Stenotrophomonas ginsengisoli]